jgi:glycosyltransferase involved in cell wall biosynthesis
MAPIDVSVVVPTRNRCAFLSMTLRSVMRQQGVSFEIVVVDEASSDGTSAMLAALADPRIRIIRHAMPVGVGAARNRGAWVARGEWLAFLDDDDLWAPDKLVTQLEAARTTGRDWAYTGAVVFRSDGEIVRAQQPLPPAETVRALLRYDAIPGGGSNVVVRRAIWQQAGPFDTRLRNTEDWEMWIRLAKLGPPACVNRPLVARRLHASNSSLEVAEIVRGTRRIEALHRTTADWGRLHRWMAHCCLRTGQRRDALRHFARAAVRGQMGAVVSDLYAVAKERFGADRERAPAHEADPWIVPAAEWLQAFRESLGENTRLVPGTGSC